ncbi:MAG: cystathionine gamma-synthase [Candidatus Obscuribacterales bacterium]|nr:cystathionine gamma-synthase [Steroidobacteraceae bacterium]
MSEKNKNDAQHPATRAVRAALESDTQFGAVVPPIHLSSTFAFAGFEQRRQYDYGRSGNPTRDSLAAAIADLEGAAGGVITASGMAAVTLVTQLLAPGDVLIAPHDCYGGTYRLFNSFAQRGLFDVLFIDQSEQTAWSAALARNPKLIWVETPSNPLLRITDIESVATQARAQQALLVVDNTFLSPVWQRPIALGADIVVHSTTKYLNGHSDVVGGAVLAASKELQAKLDWWANCIGVTGAPFDSYLTLRGLRTLHARMTIHGSNAMTTARFLAEHPAVKTVHYPGLATHPQHALATRQQQGYGAMVSFELRGGVEGVRTLVSKLKLFSLAESLGGVESLIAHPATMTHAAMDADARQRAGLVDGLLRLSIGIEAVEDLVADLKTALDSVK